MKTVWAIRDMCNVLYFDEEVDAVYVDDRQCELTGNGTSEIVEIPVWIENANRNSDFLYMLKPRFGWMLPDMLFATPRDANTYWRLTNRSADAAGAPEVVKVRIVPASLESGYAKLAKGNGSDE